jgi:ABC transport system ATP-binding/permease protein
MVSETLAVRGPSPLATIFKLIIEDDEGKTTVYPLAEGDISIGRKEGNTIRLMERNVSRRHARLLRNNGAVFIEDLDSYNGIRINGERISGRYEVKEGDLVEIGDYHLALQRQELEDAAEEDAAPKAEAWPAVGTVPDFRLPEEILADAPQPDPTVSTRDTIVDQPAPPELPVMAQIVPDGPVGVPHKEPQKHGPQLPPFPTPSSPPPARVPFFSGAAAPPIKPGDDEPTKSLSVGPSRVAGVPRLICVSTNYAGREFALTRPELIIGRVEDNDIVIEHRSVSRNHAKILFDGRTHKIIDLQSANGILVNGEEYAMTDLRKGDLIELGHVRFRFVPAGEDFACNDDEAREMREAGVEPPAGKGDGAPLKPMDVGSEVSYDPSTAATVTDTPLSALNMNEVFAPKVEVPKSNPAAQRRRDSHSPKNGATPKRAGEDERPTEMHQVSSRVPASAAPTAPMISASPEADALEQEFTKPRAALSLAEDPPRRSGSPFSMMLIGMVVLGILAAVGAFFFNDALTGPGDEADRQLNKLVQEGKLPEAHQFCLGKPSFANPFDAARICLDVDAKLKALQPQGDVKPEKDPGLEGELAAVDGEDDEGAEDDAEPAGDDPKAKQTVSKSPKRPPPDPSVAAARNLFKTGKKALLGGRLSQAKDALTECVDKNPAFADCHRLLGVLYAQLDDTKLAVQHYKRYIQLKPNAPEAAKIRKMIRDVEQGAEPEPPQ